MRLSRSRVLAAAVVPLVLLAGACGSSESKTKAANPLDTVTVGGDTAKAPALTFTAKPFSVKQTESKVVTAGKGATLTANNSIGANYVLVNGKDGKQIESSFGKKSASIDLSDDKLLPGLKKGLVGQKVGSRVIVALPPAEGFADQGRQIGVGESDTVLFLVDVLSAKTPLARAEGTPVPPKAGLPTVKVEEGKPATFAIPKTRAPSKLVVQPLIQGKGVAVAKGQTIKAAYTGVVWADGRLFDSSAADKGGRQFPIGVGAVIPAWDKGLVGQKIGSRVLIIAPPVEGYGTAGKPEAKIKGTDTLVFVVDILDAN